MSPLRLLHLAFRCGDLRTRGDHARVDLGYVSLCDLECRLLLCAVQSEDRRTYGDFCAGIYKYLSHSTVCFGNNRNGAKEANCIGSRRMKIKNNGDQHHSEHYARRNAIPQFIPNRKNGDLVTEALSLHIS